MPERDAHDIAPPAPGSGPPATPRVSGEQPSALSDTPLPSGSAPSAPAEEQAALSEPSDTLLSAGKPADRLELALDDRLATVDERLRGFERDLQEVDARLLVLEQKKSIVAPEPRQKPWLWIAFLIALVVVFQLLRRMR